MEEPNIPDASVSRKLKATVYILTAVTLLAFAVFITKLITKYSAPKNQEKNLMDARIVELNKTGQRLQQFGYYEQAIDQYVEVWNLNTTKPSSRSEAAFNAGKLYLKLDDCKNSLIWLFRAEAANPNASRKIKPLINNCAKKDQ